MSLRQILCRHDWAEAQIFFPPPPHDGMLKAICKKCQKVQRHPGEYKPYEASPEESAALGKLAEAMKMREVKQDPIKQALRQAQREYIESIRRHENGKGE